MTIEELTSYIKDLHREQTRLINETHGAASGMNTIPKDPLKSYQHGKDVGHQWALAGILDHIKRNTPNT